jgi:hypothetical protein
MPNPEKLACEMGNNIISMGDPYGSLSFIRFVKFIVED